MKVKLIGRKIYLPKVLIQKAGLPESGVCEALVVGDEVRIRKEPPKELSMSTILKKKVVTAEISHMVRAEEVEDV